MSDFFTARIDGYEEHMLSGGREAYEKMAQLVPNGTKHILDLGCGTGLELDEILKRLPDVSVVGIDLTQAMLDRLRQKHPDKHIEVICGDYFRVDFGKDAFDAAVSYESLHHFSREDKVGLYTRIRQALRASGVYIECDYMVTEQSVEDELFAENARLRRELNIPLGEYYHFDTPYTIDNQIAMLKQADFASARAVFRMENTTIIVAKKAR